MYIPCLQGTSSARYLVCSVPCLHGTSSAGYFVCRVLRLQCALSAVYLVCSVPCLQCALSAGYLVCSVPCLHGTSSAVYLVCSVPCLQCTLSAGYLVCRVPCLQVIGGLQSTKRQVQCRHQTTATVMELANTCTSGSVPLWDKGRRCTYCLLSHVHSPYTLKCSGNARTHAPAGHCGSTNTRTLHAPDDNNVPSRRIPRFEQDRAYLHAPLAPVAQFARH